MRCLYQILVFICLLPCSRHALSQIVPQGVLGEIVLDRDEDGFFQIKQSLQRSENARLVAIGLDITLGLFGVHRMYLGTDVKVPIAYTLTFGGGGVLWFADLILLIASPSIEKYKDNPHLFMWIPAVPKTQ